LAHILSDIINIGIFFAAVKKRIRTCRTELGYRHS
jgi:hypothetical protein